MFRPKKRRDGLILRPEKYMFATIIRPKKCMKWMNIRQEKCGIDMERTIYKELISWKNKTDRKPLVLNGARQVGNR